jgi:membrane-associated protein
VASAAAADESPGYWLGRVAVVRDHVELFIVGIVALSLVPVALETLRARRAAGRAA